MPTWMMANLVNQASNNAFLATTQQCGGISFAEIGIALALVFGGFAVAALLCFCVWRFF